MESQSVSRLMPATCRLAALLSADRGGETAWKSNRDLLQIGYLRCNKSLWKTKSRRCFLNSVAQGTALISAAVCLQSPAGYTLFSFGPHRRPRSVYFLLSSGFFFLLSILSFIKDCGNAAGLQLDLHVAGFQGSAERGEAKRCRVVGVKTDERQRLDEESWSCSSFLSPQAFSCQSLWRRDAQGDNVSTGHVPHGPAASSHLSVTNQTRLHAAFPL